jgi:hypothetical protein
VGVQGKRGDEVRIPVRIQSALNAVYSLGLEITYDVGVLEYTGFERGDLVKNFDMFDVNISTPGQLRIGGLSTSSGIQKKASGYLVWLKFKVIAGQEKECSSLEPIGLADDLADFTSSRGCFYIGSCNGDLNQDGSITPADALIAFKCYLGSLSGPCPDCADVNQDNTVSPADALCLFKKYLGQPSCLD